MTFKLAILRTNLKENGHVLLLVEKLNCGDKARNKLLKEKEGILVQSLRAITANNIEWKKKIRKEEKNIIMLIIG